MLSIKALISKLEGRKLLWENPNPSAAFGAGSAYIADIADYDVIEIEFYYSAVPVRLYKGSNRAINCLQAAWNGAPSYRNATLGNDGVTFSEGFKNSVTVDNTVAVPYRIYGIRKLGGGYSLKVFSVLSRLVRGWEYAKYKENTYEDSHLYGRADESSSRRFLHNINSSESRNMEVCIGNNSIGVHSTLLQDIWCKPRLDKHYKYIDIRFRQHFDNRLFLPEYHKRSNKLFSWWRCNPGENIVAYSNTSGRGCPYA